MLQQQEHHAVLGDLAGVRKAIFNDGLHGNGLA